MARDCKEQAQTQMEDGVQPHRDRRLDSRPLPPPPRPGPCSLPAMQHSAMRFIPPCSDLNASNDNRRRRDGREPRVDEILCRLLAARRLDVLRVLGQVGAVRVKSADRVGPDVEAEGKGREKDKKQTCAVRSMRKQKSHGRHPVCSTAHAGRGAPVRSVPSYPQHSMYVCS